MVVLVYLLLFLAVLLISHKKFRRWINVVSFFAFLWCAFGSISSLGLYHLRVPDLKVHQYAWLFVISVCIPFLIGAKKNDTKSDDIHSEDSAIRAGNVGLVHAFTLVMLLPLLFKMVAMFIRYGSLTAIRSFFFSGDVFSSLYVDTLFRQLPFGMLEGLIVCYVYCYTKSASYKYLICATVDTLLATLVSGGRYPVMLLIYSLVIIMITDKSRRVFRKRFTKRIKFLVVAGAAFMLAITLNRGQAIIKNIVVYFSGSFSFLDYIISDPTRFALQERTYGYLLLGAFFEPAVLLLKVLGLTDAKVPQWYFNTYCQQFYNIGTTTAPIYYNNNTSIIYYLLRDFGVAGIVIGGVAFGFVLSKLHNQMAKGNVWFSLVYIYMSNILFNTVMTYQLFGMVPMFVFLALFLCSRKTVVRFKFR